MSNFDTEASGVFNFHVGPDASDTMKHTIPTFVQTGTAIGLASTETVSTTSQSACIYNSDRSSTFKRVEREQAGAAMNRLDFTMANLSNMATNLALAKGRIEDADFAKKVQTCTNTGSTAGVNGNVGTSKCIETTNTSFIPIGITSNTYK